MLGVEDVDVASRLDVAGADNARAILAQHEALGALGLHGNGDFLDVEDHVRHVLADAGNRRELMQHAVDVNRRHGRALKRRQEDAAQRVAEGGAEAALERLRHEGGDAAAVAARLNVELRRTDQFLPVLLIHLHLFASCRKSGSPARGAIFTKTKLSFP